MPDEQSTVATVPATKPTSPSSWVSAPSERPRSAASTTHTTITMSTQLTVRRVDLAHADELMGGTIFAPVRSYLEKALKGQDST